MNKTQKQIEEETENLEYIILCENELSDRREEIKYATQ